MEFRRVLFRSPACDSPIADNDAADIGIGRCPATAAFRQSNRGGHVMGVRPHRYCAFCFTVPASSLAWASASSLSSRAITAATASFSWASPALASFPHSMPNISAPLLPPFLLPLLAGTLFRRRTLPPQG